MTTVAADPFLAWLSLPLEQQLLSNPTREQMQEQAHRFLLECVKAARLMAEMQDLRLAREMLIDSMLAVTSFRERLDAEVRTIQSWSEPRYKKGGVQI